MGTPHVAPKGGPKCTQDGPQNGPKSKTKTMMKKEALEDRLGTVLERSWADLGSSWGAPGGPERAVAAAALVFFLNRLLETKKLQEATWAHVGPK